MGAVFEYHRPQLRMDRIIQDPARDHAEVWGGIVILDYTINNRDSATRCHRRVRFVPAVLSILPSHAFEI